MSFTIFWPYLLCHVFRSLQVQWGSWSQLLHSWEHCMRRPLYWLNPMFSHSFNMVLHFCFWLWPSDPWCMKELYLCQHKHWQHMMILLMIDLLKFVTQLCVCCHFCSFLYGRSLEQHLKGQNKHSKTPPSQNPDFFFCIFNEGYFFPWQWPHKKLKTLWLMLNCVGLS